MGKNYDKSKIDSVIEKTEAQTKLLKKLLTQLNKQNEELKNDFPNEKTRKGDLIKE
jgi:hypothetical protein